MLLSEVSLYTATKEQKLESWRRVASQWGLGLTFEEWMGRKLTGEQEECARDGKMMTWVLAARNDPTTLDFFCACETIKREIVISRPSDPRPTKGYGYGITSVFTPIGNRGKGYAKHMMRLLHWVLAPETYLSTQQYPEAEWGPRPLRVDNMGDASVAVLWTIVGREFYKACGMGLEAERGDGWEVTDSMSDVWEAVGGDHLGGEQQPDAVWLDKQKAKDIWDADGELIRGEVVEACKERGETQFSFLPGGGLGEFQWFRLHYHFSRYIASPPEYQGVQIHSGRVFATWGCEFRPGIRKTLIITRLRATEDTVEELMLLVFKYAKDHGLEAVEAWNLPKRLSDALKRLGGSRFERDNHYPSMKWYEASEKAGWMFNERFCWC